MAPRGSRDRRVEEALERLRAGLPLILCDDRARLPRPLFAAWETAFLKHAWGEEIWH